MTQSLTNKRIQLLEELEELKGQHPELEEILNKFQIAQADYDHAMLSILAEGSTCATSNSENMNDTCETHQPATAEFCFAIQKDEYAAIELENGFITDLVTLQSEGWEIKHAAMGPGQLWSLIFSRSLKSSGLSRADPEPLPCPFCGYTKINVRHISQNSGAVRGYTVYAECDGCSSRGSWEWSGEKYHSHADREAQAIEAWNRRVEAL